MALPTARGDVPAHQPAHQRGLTYLGLLFVVAWVGLAAAATLQVGAVYQRRQAEDELLFVGAAWRAALRSYQEARPSPDGRLQAPRELRELLADHRFNPPRRHLRQIHRDPITGLTTWGLLRAADGGIVGVHSLSAQTPIRVANFPADFFFFNGRQRYSDWIFVWGVACTDAGCEVDHPRDGLRAPPPRGGHTGGPAKPYPRCSLDTPTACGAGGATREDRP